MNALYQQLGINDQDLLALAHVGYSYLEMGSPKMAEVIFSGLINLHGNEPYYFFALAYAKDQLNKKREAIDLYRKSVSLNPTDVRSAVNLAELYAETGHMEYAINILNNIKEKTQDSQTPLMKKASSLLKLYNRALAIRKTNV